MIDTDIVIKGAREHNLRNLDLTLPRNRLIVMTGVSGSGKSSLAFDTLYAEGQRRYVESLSSYARQFLGQMPKPDVDVISGLAPSISIQQKSSGHNPRSTVGTITEVYDYLRVLYARVGVGHCPRCDQPVAAQSREQILAALLQFEPGLRYMILAPLVQRQKGAYSDLFEDLLKQGFLRARVDGRIASLSADLRLERQMRHTIEVVIDRVQSGSTPRARLAEAIDLALKLGKGTLIAAFDSPEADIREIENDALADEHPSNESDDDSGPINAAATDRIFSSQFACTACGLSFEAPSPQLFSFNSPQGYCTACEGLGETFDYIVDKVIQEPELSVSEGAVSLGGSFKTAGKWRRHLLKGVAAAIDRIFGLAEGTAADAPWNTLSPEVQDAWLDGLGEREITFVYRNRGSVFKHVGRFNGLFGELREEYRRSSNSKYRGYFEQYMELVACPACNGTRLNPQARGVRITTSSPSFLNRLDELGFGDSSAKSRSANGAGKDAESTGRKRRAASPSSDRPARQPGSLSLPDVCGLTIADAAAFFESLALEGFAAVVAGELLKEIRGRLGFLLQCGLDYLTLDRGAPTLSGGESQRIRLASQIGCGLVGVIYILDEPSIGLHPRDNDKLLASLLELRNLGNTVIVVEHDEDTIRAADHVIDFGPGPGVRGGEVVAIGSLADVAATEKSVTGAYLSGRSRIEVPRRRRSPTRKRLTLRGVTHNNLNGLNVEIPLGLFVCVTGVSGSGKSSLVNDVLWQALHRDLNGGDGKPGPFSGLLGLEHLDKAIDIDQSPIGRTPRSNPATYTKLFDLIRDLYTELPESKLRGYKPGRFSFNVPGGRCEACEGHGAVKLEMDFLADVWVKCTVCEGRRFAHETLQVHFKEKSIADVLEMEVGAAMQHFENHPRIFRLLDTLRAVGLDYMRLGQPSPTLSGGEAQRIKLSRELGKRSTGRTIYLLDEPTTGLHFADVHRLLDVLHGLVAAGNTVLVVEHNLDVIKTADWVIDLGPEGGRGGGRIVVEGPPETVAACAESHTGRALQRHLAQSPVAPVVPVEPDVPSKGRKTKGRKGAAASTSAASVSTASTSITSASAASASTASTSITSASTASASIASASTASTSTASTSITSASTASALTSSMSTAALSAGAAQSIAVVARPIVVRGAEQNNLQHVDVEIPRHSFSVFSGPSGSGKTSLAMDTLYAEGQRRYVESLSSYARQFLGQMPKPRVDSISGLSPAIAIEQKTVGHSPRSTVGTVTELYDYFRILFARLGQPYCPDCDIPVRPQTTDEVVDRLLQFPPGTRLLLTGPQIVEVGQNYDELWTRLEREGYRRVRINGETHTLDRVPKLDRRRRHGVEVVVDRVSIAPSARGRITESAAAALSLGRGWMRAVVVDDKRPEVEWRVEPFSLLRACLKCGSSFEELTPRMFSFNSVQGWCPTCEGLGVQQGTNLAALISNPQRTLRDGAVSLWPDLSHPLFAPMAAALSTEGDLPLDTPFALLSPRQQRLVLYGAGDRWFTAAGSNSQPGFRFQYKGLYPALEEASRSNPMLSRRLQDFAGEIPCTACNGSRLRRDAAAVRFGDRVLQQVNEMSLGDLHQWLNGMSLTDVQKKVAGDLLQEVTARLQFLVDVGLQYLTLSRPMPTLSGGESQRIRLAGQIGRALTGVLYVLDEPTIGLHPRDNARLLQSLQRLRDLGNTVVVVEHDREVIEAADNLYDFGPGAGRLGGRITASGSPTHVAASRESLTGGFLSGRESIPIPSTRRMAHRCVDGIPVPALISRGELKELEPPGQGWLQLRGARLNNLRGVDLCIPLGTLTCVTGVSGSGKSSLVEETLSRELARRLHYAREKPGPFDSILGVQLIDKVIRVDQTPLGSTPASNPATYTGVFDLIRDLFAHLPEAKVRGYGPGRFSFNRSGGRCESCEGNGQKRIEMHFLPDIWAPCDDCGGKRFNPETLSVRYRGQSIADVLEMSVSQALELFDNIARIRGLLSTLAAVGLDYVKLGQSAATLSGGEAQRVKLAAELARPQSGQTMYILDEPTTGLHFDDIRKLLRVLHSLVEKGNTVVVVEHNLDVIKTADWVIDLGPEAGVGGGWITAEGTPEDIVAIASRAAAASGGVSPGVVPPRGVSSGGVSSEVVSSSNGRAKSARKRAASIPSDASLTVGQNNGESVVHRSWTGELLAPILAAATRADIDIFDSRAAARKRKGDVDPRGLVRESKMPWKIDGRDWHCRGGRALSGEPRKWEGAALELVIDELEKVSGLPSVNWNDRSLVEIAAPRSSDAPWFLHAFTGDEWLLSLYFRVKRGTFEEDLLATALKLRDFDDIDELPVFGRGDRVRTRSVPGVGQDVFVSVHWKREIDTQAFRSFLKKAAESWLSLAGVNAPAKRTATQVAVDDLRALLARKKPR